MRAYVVERPDGAFTPVEVARPVPSAGQVLVRVHASGVNPLDTKIRAGKAVHAKQPLPAVLGVDMAGVVARMARIFAAATKCTAWLAASASCRARSRSSSRSTRSCSRSNRSRSRCAKLWRSR